MSSARQIYLNLWKFVFSSHSSFIWLTIRWFLFTFMSVWVLRFVLLRALIRFQLPFFEARSLFFVFSASKNLNAEESESGCKSKACSHRRCSASTCLYWLGPIVCACMKRIAKQASKSNMMNRMPYGPPANFLKCVQETRIFMHTLNTNNEQYGRHG